MPLSEYALNTYVAQELGDIRTPVAQSVRDEFPNLENWIASFIIKSIFHFTVPANQTALAFALMRRAQAAIEEYHEACAALALVARRERTIGSYFKALRKLESTVTMLYQAYDYGRKALSVKLFESGDGTPYQRLNAIYNRSRHPDVTQLPPGHLHPVWARNDGIYTDGTKLEYQEIEALLREIGRIAESIANGNA